MNFPAKILLFGEYGILLNSMALAIPYSRFSGQFRFVDVSTNRLSGRETESNDELNKLFNYLNINALKFNHIDLIRMKEEIRRGLFFDSSIPSGFGLGSSGALTAALYTRYATGIPHSEYQKIKSNLAEIETYFHGTSSGIDPLTSFLKKPVLLENGTTRITTVDLSSFFNTYSLYLIDSHSKGETGNLVSHFMEQYRQSEFKEKIDCEYIPIINQTIGTITAGDFKSFEVSLARYSLFQLINFEEMIPVVMRKFFKYGIESGDFYLKLCGSGGGGYLLAISRKRSKTESYFLQNHLEHKLV